MKMLVTALLLLGLAISASAPLHADGNPERHCQFDSNGVLHCPPVTP